MIYRLAVTLTVLGFLLVTWLLDKAVHYNSFELVGEAAGVLFGTIMMGIVAMVFAGARYERNLRHGWRQTRRVA